tara:strand:+ start:389 stop:1852 length:1464 start_codon:yes stop_codon:yes gene_type:complete
MNNLDYVRANIKFDNTYFRELSGFYSPVDPIHVPDPKLICFNNILGDKFDLSSKYFDSPEGAQLFSGNIKPDGAQTLSQVYAGHQFGGYSPQLGDGRAVLLGEIFDKEGNRFDLQLKGSGRTPYSRGGDGKAAVGPVLREYIISEAMNALKIPSTRSLAAVSTGEQVYREKMLPGAVLTRVASSHIRVGTFQYIASLGDKKKLKKMADYAINRHFKDIWGDNNPYLQFLKEVSDKQASLIAKWMNIGFIHGVMNTDNMSISGETIDYGPCAFMDSYLSSRVFSSIDTGGRYAFKNQPIIGQWNIARLAETLLPLIDEDLEKAISKATEVVEKFIVSYDKYWLDGMRGKLGINNKLSEDYSLATEFLEILETNKLDFTKSFLIINEERSESFFNWVNNDMRAVDWFHKLECRKKKNINDKSKELVNPIFIPRNHLVEEVIVEAYEGDLAPLKKLVEILNNPYERSNNLDYFANPPEVINESYKTFCGT